jgi:hypothetical protein
VLVGNHCMAFVYLTNYFDKETEITAGYNMFDWEKRIL